MKINITLLNQYLVNADCPTQIILDTDDQERVLRFLRGPDENGSLAVFLSYQENNQILSINDVESKMIEIRDLPYDQFKKGKEKEDVINNILYGTLSKYVMQLFAASSGRIIFEELEILPVHKKTYFASIFNGI
jgi:hypothetical protein